jgi:hypothetical protein
MDLNKNMIKMEVENMKNFKQIIVAIMLLFGSSLFLQAQEGEQPRRMMMPAGEYKWVSGKTSTTIPFMLDRDLIVINVEINGVNAKLILDTGMPMMGGLINGTLKAEKLNLLYSGEAMIGGAGGGGANAKIANGVNFKIGELMFSNQTLIVMPDSPNLSYFETDGIIGAELFNRFIVEIDYEKQLVTLTEPSNYKVKIGFEEIPLTFNYNYPFISCTSIMESGKVVPLNLVLDIGAGHAVSLNIGSQNDIILPEKNIKVSLGRGVVSEIFGYKGRIKEFKIGTNRLSNVLISFSEDKLAPWEVEGNLGSGIMKRFNLVIDFPNKRIFIKPNKFFTDPFEFNMAGIQTSKLEGMIKIDTVLPNSAGSEAGLKVNDVIIKVNDIETCQINNEDFSKLFEKEDRIIVLTIQRGDTTKTIPVKLRRII